MNIRNLCTATIWLLALTVFQAVAESSPTVTDPALKQAQAETSWNSLRLLRDEDRQPKALQVSIVRYEPRGDRHSGVSVDLVSAIHVADRAYYADLNRRFREYDAVLYELIASEDNNVPMPLNALADNDAAERKASMVTTVQLFLKNTLGLSFQLEEVNYTPSNMVHADMTPEEFEASMAERGESMFGMFAKLWMAGMSQSMSPGAGGAEIKLLMSLFSSDREHALKVFTAEQFVSAEAMFKSLEGEEGSTIVTERNKKALKVLKRELAAGKKRLAIFYGAAHMGDMALRLESDFGLTPVSETWVDAWNLE